LLDKDHPWFYAAFVTTQLHSGEFRVKSASGTTIDLRLRGVDTAHLLVTPSVKPVQQLRDEDLLPRFKPLPQSRAMGADVF